MTDKTYNGWSSYETWLVNLWQDNDQGSYNYNRERAQEIYDRAREDEAFTKAERATFDLADALKEEYEQAQSEIVQGASVWSDLLGAALSEVNWHEIAEHLIGEVDKEEETV